MAATAEDWYAGTVKPTASVAEYAAAPPKGMTNPPQNPKVRALLLQDLNEQGRQLTMEVWPPPKPQRDAPPGFGSAELRWHLGTMNRAPSCPAVFGGVSCPASSLKPLPKVRPHPGTSSSKADPKPPSKTADKKAKTVSAEDKAPKWIYSAELDKHEEEFEIFLERVGSKRIGIAEYAGCLFAVPQRGTLLYKWNQDNPDELVRHSDRIMEVNEVRDNKHKMMKQFRKSEAWVIKLRKAWHPDADVLAQTHGSPTARWRNRAPFQLEGSPLGSGPSGPPSAAALAAALGLAPGVGDKDTSRGGLKRGKDKSDDKEGWQHPDQMKMNARVPTEDELKNARRLLKGQSGLHSSAMGDRFKFTADLSPGVPMCIRGSGTAKGGPAEIWASDGAGLVAFHNGAIRGVSPSKLQRLPETPYEEKKRRKGAADELNLSESGLFKPTYPIDNSLQNLRRLKKKAFPEACRTEKEIARMKKEAEVRETVKQSFTMFDRKDPAAGGEDAQAP